MRSFAAFVIASTLLVAFSGTIGVVRASDGLFLPLHSDYAVDTDLPPDGLYDELVVNVTIDVSVSGLFYVNGNLYDSSGSVLIENQFVPVGLDTGVRTIQLVFTGYLIQVSGFNGPYHIDLTLLDDQFMVLDVGIHTTSPYFAASFQRLPAHLSPPHLDYGLDNDLDSFFDYLITSVKIEVNVSGEYTVVGVLYESMGLSPITSGYNGTLLSVGTYTVDIAFLGYAIRASGFDGPYRVELELLEESSKLLATGTYFTNAHLADSFEQPPVSFMPPHSDRGVDLNGNSIYEYLVVTASVAVFSDGAYYVEGITSFGTAKNMTNLTTGVQSVDLWFLGVEIRKAGASGRHSVDIIVRDEFLNMLDYNLYNTSAYGDNEFELNPPCTLSSPHRERGIDIDGDSQHDVLAVTANVTVDAYGFYKVRADLIDSLGTTLIFSAESSRILGTGLQSLVVLFDGLTIFDSGIDGPYNVALALYDVWGYSLDNDVLMTQPYLHTDFELPPAVLEPPHTDYGLDTDVPPNGLYNFLIVEASIRVRDPGWYTLYCTLTDTYFNAITTAQKFTFLFAGPTSLSLEFNGMNISRNGVDGPYVVYMDLYLISGETPIHADSDIHITNAYNYTDFMAPINANIWGYVYRDSDGSPVEGAQITAVNYTYGWISQMQTNATGYYEIKAFDGDFCVLVDSRDLQANITYLPIAGSTEITRYLEDSVPNVVTENMVQPDWDNIEYSMRSEVKTDNRSTRFMVDLMVGNKDGYVDQIELNIMALLIALSAPPPSNTIDLFSLDGIHFDFIPGSYALVLEGIGPVTSLEPSFMTLFANYTSNSTIPASSIHWLELNMTYDSSEETIVHNSLLPPSFGLWGYLPANNVTISGIGSQNFVIDPLMDPDPFDAFDSIWINLTVGQGAPDVEPPQVSNVLLNDMASPTYGKSELPSVVYLNATIDDTSLGNVPIAGANHTIGIQNWASSAPMNPIDGSFDSVSEEVTVMIVPQSVTTTYCVYGWDYLLNYNTAGSCISMTVLDDMAPEIYNIVMTPATFFLSSAPPTTTLTATVDDTSTGSSMIFGANYTTPLADSWPGTPMIATDGTFDETTEDVAANIPLP
ncbi:MAG: carboxypeptidase regulatory-like domain-containing protein, partial [Methanobacteriota archaeon]